MKNVATKWSCSILFITALVLLSSCGGGGGGSVVDDNNKPPDYVNTAPPSNLSVTNDHTLRFTGAWSDADDGNGDVWSVEWYCDKGKLGSDGSDSRITPLPAKVSELPVSDGLKINVENRKTIIKWEPPNPDDFCYFTVTMRITDRGGEVSEKILRRVYNYPLAANKDPDLILMRPMPFDPRGFVKGTNMSVELILLNISKPMWDGASSIWWDAYACTPAYLKYPNSFVDWGGRMTKANPQTYTPGGLDPWEPEIISQDRLPWQENKKGTEKEMDDDYGINWLASTDMDDYRTEMPGSRTWRSLPWELKINSGRNKSDIITYNPNPDYPGIVAKMEYKIVNNNKPVDNLRALELFGGFQGGDFLSTIPANTTGIASNFVVSIDTDKPFTLGIRGRDMTEEYSWTAYDGYDAKYNVALDPYRYQIVNPIKP